MFRIANKTAFLSAKHGAWNFDMFQKWVEKIKRERKQDIAELAEKVLSGDSAAALLLAQKVLGKS
jgi:hypothetical protein